MSTDAESASAMRVAPVTWSTGFGGYVVSGFVEASQVLRGDGWSSDPRRRPNVDARFRSLPPGVMLFMDAPEHTRIRRLVSPAFTPRAISRLRPRVAAIVDAVLDGIDGDEFDLLAEVAYLVPLAVIAELLDVGAEGAALFREQTPDLVRILEIDAGPEDVMASIVASTEIMFFLTPLLAERRRHPGRDFLSALLDRLEPQEVLATCVLLLTAGHETTANLIANGTYALLRHPDQRSLLLEDPDRAVEELLRVEGSVKIAGRVATVPQDLGGQRIEAGSQVFVDLRAANRDPRRFADPLRLDLSREPVGHLAFGGGPHFCLGAALARLEAAETLTRLFTRFPALGLAKPPEWRASTTFHSLRGLQVTRA